MTIAAARRRRHLVSLFIPIVLAGVTSAACAGGLEGPSGWIQQRFGGGKSALHSGPAAPFAFETFDGRRVDFQELQGRPVVLNFWASWCIPCRAEMPYFEQIYQEYRGRGVEFVGLAVQDDPDAAPAFVRTLGISYPTGLDRRSAVSTAYGLLGLPTTVLIGSDGTIVRRWNGPVSEDELRSVLAANVR